MDVTQVEDMSHRQVTSWVEFFTESEVDDGTAGSNGAIQYGSLSKADLKAAFR